MSSTPNTGVMTSAQFIAKWSKSQLSERAASQGHFIDLCRLLGQRVLSNLLRLNQQRS